MLGYGGKEEPRECFDVFTFFFFPPGAMGIFLSY